MSSLNVILNGARGGQGTSTVAAVLALYAAGHAATHLVAHEPSATAALLGINPLAVENVTVTDRLTLAAAPIREPAVRIFDSALESEVEGTVIRLTVLRGPCYLALRTLVAEHDRPIDGIVLVSEAGRSLTGRDVADVVGAPVVATVPVDPGIARTIDAGLLVARLHRLPAFAPLRRYMTALLSAHDPQTLPSAPAATPATALGDLNRRHPESVDMTGTDLPVAQSATGGGSTRRRAESCSRAYPTCTTCRAGRTCAEHWQAERRRRRVLHRRGSQRSGGLLHGPR